MNPVSLPIIPTIPGRSAVASRPGAQREEQAAFSPVLLTLLAMPVLPVTPVAPATGAEGTKLDELVLHLPESGGVPSLAVEPDARKQPAVVKSLAASTGVESPPDDTEPAVPTPRLETPPASPPKQSIAETLTPVAAQVVPSAMLAVDPRAAALVAAGPALPDLSPAPRVTSVTPRAASNGDAAPIAPVPVARARPALPAGAQDDRSDAHDSDRHHPASAASRNAAPPLAGGSARFAPSLLDQAAAPAPPPTLAQDPLLRAAEARGETATANAAGAPADPRLAPNAEAARAARPEQITLRIEGDAGAEARLRIAVRGNDVRATIVADDPALAHRLEAGLGSLRQALGERGFERAQLLVQSAGGARDGGAPTTVRQSQTSRRDADTDASADQRRSDTTDQRPRRRGERDGAER